MNLVTPKAGAKHEFVKHLSWAYVAQQCMTKYIMFVIWSHLKLHLSYVFIGEGYTISPATATLTTYLPWPPWAERQR